MSQTVQADDQPGHRRDSEHGGHRRAQMGLVEGLTDHVALTFSLFHGVALSKCYADLIFLITGFLQESEGISAPGPSFPPLSDAAEGAL